MEPNKELEKAIEKKFLTPSKFAIEIEKIVAEEELNYIDAICHYCEMNDIEVESVSKLMSKPLKERLKYDAINLTIGLPFIRISPDHGPNENMLGKNKSNPLSLIKTFEFAEKIK